MFIRLCSTQKYICQKNLQTLFVSGWNNSFAGGKMYGSLSHIFVDAAKMLAEAIRLHCTNLRKFLLLSLLKMAVIGTSIPLKPYFKEFCWGISNISHGWYLTYHPSHRHERTVTVNDVLEATQIDKLST